MTISNRKIVALRHVATILKSKPPVPSRPRAKVLLIRRPFRDAGYIQRHVRFVLQLDAERGEQHVRHNLACIRHRLEEMGIDGDVIDREVRSIEAAVRAELWRQVLLGGEQFT